MSVNANDLDRCEHGRHVRDRCFDCPGGWSMGNPHLIDNPVVGYYLGGVPIRLADVVEPERVSLVRDRRA